MSSVVTLYGMKELQAETAPVLKVDWLDPKQNIGIEVEVEFDRDTITNPSNLNFWTVKSDGSLRRGQEFVLSRPLRGDALSGAIEEFFQQNRVYKSPTSGTHIHVDMRDKVSTLDVVKTMASIIVCIEPAIFGMFAEGREWCGYTNPITTIGEEASYSVFSDKADSDAFRSVFTPDTREYKYYGFNMLPLGRYGSVEFRYFNTAENANELIEWVQFCMAVKMAAVSINTRSSFKYYLQDEVCWEEFLSRYFTQWRDRLLPLLPYKEVRMRYKQTRSRAHKLSRRGQKATAMQKENKLKDTRFKKFFAVKVKDKATGKSKLVYDIDGVATNMPVRVFITPDTVINSYEFNKRDGDFLVTNDFVYRYSASRHQWMEVLLYGLNPDRVIDSVSALSSSELTGFMCGVAARVTNIIDEPNVVNLTVSNGGWRDRLVRVAAIVERHHTPTISPEGMNGTSLVVLPNATYSF